MLYEHGAFDRCVGFVKDGSSCAEALADQFADERMVKANPPFLFAYKFCRHVCRPMNGDGKFRVES